MRPARRRCSCRAAAQTAHPPRGSRTRSQTLTLLAGRSVTRLSAALLESRQAVLEIEPVEVSESGAALCITRASLPQRPDVEVSVRVSELELPLRPLDPAAARRRAEQARERVSAGDQSASVDLQRALIEQDLAERFPDGDTGRARPVAIRLGDELALVGWPGELSGAYDHAFQAAAQPVHVITATNVCDSVGYLPAYPQFAEGGYEVDASPFLPRRRPVRSKASRVSFSVLHPTTKGNPSEDVSKIDPRCRCRGGAARGRQCDRLRGWQWQ